MAKIHRSQAGPLLFFVGIGGVCVVVMGLFSLLSGDTGRGIMYMVGGGFMLLVLLTQSGSKSNRAKAAVRSAFPEEFSRNNPKFVAIYNMLPNCTNQNKLRDALAKADSQQQMGVNYTTFFNDNACKEALDCIYQRSPAEAIRICYAECYKLMKVYGTYDLSTLSAEEKKYREKLQKLPYQGGFDEYRQDLIDRGVEEEIRNDIEAALREYKNHPTNEMLRYIYEVNREAAYKIASR